MRLALFAAVLALPAMAQAETLTILHTNDVHSRIEPISKYNSGCRPGDNDEGKCFGGAARMATAVRAARADAHNSILVDGGDQFQGSLYYTFYKGKAAAEMMNAIGYDAMTVGNHEFDDGPEVLRGFMDALDFPVLMANADVSDEPALAGVLMPSVVIEKGGEKIGLIGLTPQNTDELSAPGPRVRFIDPVAVVRDEVARLEAAGITRIIALSHSGFGMDQRLAERVNGLDVIVGGHTNTFLSNTAEDAEGPYPVWVTTPNGGRTAIVQAYAYGKYLGRLDVTFDDAGVVAEATGEPILIDGQVAEDSSVKDRIAALAGPLDEFRNRVVAVTAAAIDGDRASCRARECTMGNLVADAMLDRTKEQGVTIAIANSGGLRASIDEGEVTVGDILTVLPFQNVISTFGLPGADVIAALENGVSQVEEGAGRFPQVAGLRFTADLAAPAGSRISEVMVADGETWMPIDAAATYSVVSNDFLRGGGDGYVVFAENAIDPYDGGPSLEDVVGAYMAANAPYQPRLEGRITIK